jgi:hypothetical protein
LFLIISGETAPMFPLHSRALARRFVPFGLAIFALGVVPHASAPTPQSTAARPASQSVVSPPDSPGNSIGWYEVPKSTLRAVCPANTAQYDFFGLCGNVVGAWNSAIADTQHDRLVIWGGGHADYYGNEVYAFNLQDMQMTRLNDPSPINTTATCVETLADAKPNSRHTYDGLAYIAHAGRMFSFGGSLNECGFFSGATWTLDLATLQWTNMQPRGGAPHAGAGVVADYDPNTKLVYLDDVSQFWSYDFDTDTYKVRNSGAVIDYHMTGVIDPKRKLFLIMGGAGATGGGLKAISIGPSGKYSMKDWTGAAMPTCGPLLRVDYPGLAYDPVEDRIVGWPDFGNQVYLFDPDSKTCAVRAFPGGPPDSAHQGSPHTTNGTFGRFRYFPDKDVFVLVNDAATDVYLLRITPPASKAAQPAP